MKGKIQIVLLLCFCFFVKATLWSKATAGSSLLPGELPEGWVIAEGPHTYTEANLFEHIDGQAELFFKYRFKRSVFAIYKDLRNTQRQIDLDIYEMGSVLHAFGIFSRFRSEHRPAGLGRESYLDEQSLYFYQGKFFVMLYATEPNPSCLRKLAEAVSGNIQDAAPAPKEIEFFPEGHLMPGSIQYFPEGLLGHQFLKGGFQGTYKNDHEELNLFIAMFSNSREATAALGTYRRYLSRNGKIFKPSLRLGPPALEGKDPYRGEVIVVQKAAYLLGVTGSRLGTTGKDCLTGLFGNVK